MFSLYIGDVLLQVDGVPAMQKSLREVAMVRFFLGLGTDCVHCMSYVECVLFVFVKLLCEAAMVRWEAQTDCAHCASCVECVLFISDWSVLFSCVCAQTDCVHCVSCVGKIFESLLRHHPRDEKLSLLLSLSLSLSLVLVCV